jgi:hypothetical protein
VFKQRHLATSKKNLNDLRRDKKIGEILNSKWFYIVLLLLALITYKQHGLIINKPIILIYFKFLFSFSLLISILIWRYIKFKAYYQRKLRDKTYLVFLIVSSIIFTVYISYLVDLPLNYVLKVNSKKQSTKIVYCDIINYTDFKKDIVTYKFNGRTYRYYLDINGSSEDVIKYYKLQITLKSTLMGAYVIETIKPVRK